MQISKNIIGRPSKYPKLIDGLRRYLVEARSNTALKLTILAISRAIEVKKSTIYLHQQRDPEVAELLKSIRTLATARKLAALNRDGFVDSRIEKNAKTNQETSVDLIDDDDTESISLELLTVNSARAIQKAVWSMSKFIGHHRKHRYVSDLPRVLFDLDSTIAQLRRIREDLNISSDEWMQISQNNGEIVNAENQLNLSYIFEDQL